jgi:hypothetical protein
LTYHPPRALGLLVGLSALAALLAVDAALAGYVLRNLLALPGFIALLVLLASLPAVALVAYRTYSLLRSRYVVGRNALVVEWGGQRLVLPLGMVEEARPGTGIEGEVRPRGVWWPGSVVGRALVEGLGEVEFLASTGKEGLVLVCHPDGWLALSPSDPSAFLDAVAAAREQGVEEVVPPKAVPPAFQRWDLWQDWAALGLIAAGGLSVLLLLGYLTLIAPQLPPEIALHFNAQGQPDRFGPPSGLLLLPVIAGLAWLVNTTAGVWLHRYPQERTATYLLLGATVFVQALVWVATIALLTAGNAA